MSYWVTKYGHRFPADTPRIAGCRGDDSWFLGSSFGRVEDAADAAEGWLRDHPGGHLDVTNDRGKILWCSKRPVAYSGVATTHKEKTIVHCDPQKPLNIKREDLIAKLQENLDEETAKREAKEARAAADRQSVSDWVEEHHDEVVEYLGRGIEGSWANVLKGLEDRFEGDAYVPKGATPTVRENDLEKYVRVLSMATDSTIEVTPDQPIYNLL